MTFIRRHWVWLSMTALVVLVVAMLALALVRGWLIDWAITAAVRASDGRLTVENVRRFDGVLTPGWTPEGFTIGRVQWLEKDGKRFELLDSRLRLRWAALWQRELSLFEMRTKRVNVKTPPSDQDIVLPASLELPVNVSIENVAIDSMLLDIGRNPPLELRGIRFGLDYRGGTVSFNRLGLTADLGTLEGRFKLADHQPYELEGEARLFGKAAPWPDPIQIILKLKGPLNNTRIEGVSNIRDNPLEFSTELDLLANQKRPRIAWSIARFAPHRFVDQIPDYHFAAKGVLSLVPTIATSLNLRNLDPGLIDAKKLPVQELSAELKIDNQRLLANDLKITLPAKGLVLGKGQVDLDMGPNPSETWRNHVVLDLKLSNIVPANLYRGLTPADLAGVVRLDRKGLWLDLRDRGPLLAGGLSARGLVNWDKEKVRIEKAELGARDGQLLGQATVGLGKPHEFEIKADAKRFELHRWFEVQAIPGRGPLQGSLNGTILATGRIQDKLEADVDLKLRDSLLSGLALNGTVSARLLGGEQFSGLDAKLNLGSSRITAKGGFGQEGDRIDLRIQADSLDQLDKRLAGRLDLTSEIRGSLAVPALKAQWTGTGVQWRPDGAAALASVGSMRGSAEWSAEPGSTLAVQLNASAVRADNYELQQLNAAVRGTLASHQFTVSGSGAGQQLRGNGGGEVIQREGEPLAWAGRLNALDSSGRVVFSVAQPVQLAFSPKRIQIDGLDAQAFSGRVKLDRVLVAEGKLAARGEFASVLLDDLLATAQRFSNSANSKPPNSGITVRANGRFDVIGTSVADLTGSVAMDARSEPVEGSSRADLKLNAGRLSGSLNMQLPSLAWARRFIGNQWQLDGKLGFDGEVDGTIAAPKLRGAIVGSGLKLEQQVLGWRFADGVLKGQFTGDELKIEQLRLNSKTGFVELNGALQLPRAGTTPVAAGKRDFGTARFNLNAERMPFSIGPGQRFVLSGDTLVTLNHDTMTWSGRLKAEEGLIELKNLDAPAAPDDLEIVDNRPGKTKPEAAPRERTVSTQASNDLIRVQADLELDLGERFRVQGNGVDANLRGIVTLSGRLPGVPSANGTVQVRDGTYRTYGQELKIERGYLIFTGRLDNPTIDIVAMRKFQPVEAGIALSGTALAPRSRLVSEPEVPDADKLSWLVLGVSLEDASGSSQASALQAAAITLFGNDDDSSVSGGVAKALGLDVLGVRGASSTSGFSGMQGSLTEPRLPGQTGSSLPGASQQNVVTVGKRLSSRLFISYEQGLRGVWNLLKVQYDISNRFSLRALTGSESAIDLLYFFSFD